MNKKNVLPHAGGGGSLSTGFTMAEILLSLTIIGVVAAITLPSLTGNINERTWNTQRKALYARMSQAISLMPNVNAYGTINDTTDTAAETFVTAGLSKVLKMNNICSNDKFKDCGIPEKFNTLNASVRTFPTTLGELNSSLISMPSVGAIAGYSSLDTKGAAFETANGESIAVFYRPNCAYYSENPAWVWENMPWVRVFDRFCVNFIYDLNGTKGPNTLGKDMGVMSVLYASDSVVVAPVPLNSDLPESYLLDVAASECRKKDPDTRVPNQDEMISLWANATILGMDQSEGSESVYWTSSSFDSQYAWVLYFAEGSIHPARKNNYRAKVRCIKRN